jgi:dTDP-glucose 4,6-dehydratase
MIQPDAILAEDLAGILAAPLPWPALHGKRVLVTGAAGFIGGHIVETLAFLNRQCPNAGIRIHALARDLAKLRARLPWLDLPGEVEPLIQDVRTPWHAASPVDFIIHAASPASPRFYMQTPVDTILANTDGTRHLLDLARRDGARLLLLSSGTVYGENPGNIDSIGETDFGGEDPLGPRACYGESKRLAETLCRAYFTQYGVDTRIARISHCYGPGMRLDDGRAITDLLADVLAGNDIRLDSDGSATRPFCYVSDTVAGLFHILLKGSAGEAWNVGETRETSILELARKIIAAAGESGRLTVRAEALGATAPALRSAGHFNIDKIGRLGWRPAVALDAGLARMIRHWREAAPSPLSLQSSQSPQSPTTSS